MKAIQVMLFCLCMNHLYAQNNEIEVPIHSFESFSKILNDTSNVPHVINFWATWCAPCVKELPYLEEIREKYSPNEMKVTLVSLDFKKFIDSKLKPFLKEHSLKSDVVLLYEPDANAWIDKVSPEWSGAIPATLFIKNGKKTFYEGSFENSSEIEDILKSL